MNDWIEADPDRPSEPVPTVALTDAQKKARRNRSLALGIALAALAALFFVATLDKFGTNLVSVDAMREL